MYLGDVNLTTMKGFGEHRRLEIVLKTAAFLEGEGGYNFRLVESHRREEIRDFRTVGVRVGFLRRLREFHLEREVLLGVLECLQQGRPPQPRLALPVQRSK